MYFLFKVTSISILLWIQKGKKNHLYIEPIKYWDNLLISLKAQAPSLHSGMRKIGSEYLLILKLNIGKYKEYLCRKRCTIETFFWKMVKNLSMSLEAFHLIPLLMFFKMLSPMMSYIALPLLKCIVATGNMRNHVPLPLFLMQLPRQQNKPKLFFEISVFLGLQVHLEKYWGRKGPIRRHRCIFTRLQSATSNQGVLNVQAHIRLLNVPSHIVVSC